MDEDPADEPPDDDDDGDGIDEEELQEYAEMVADLGTFPVRRRDPSADVSRTRPQTAQAKTSDTYACRRRLCDTIWLYGWWTNRLVMLN